MIARRAFITLLGSAVAWPIAAEAQQAAMPMVRFLDTANRARSRGRSDHSSARS